MRQPIELSARRALPKPAKLRYDTGFMSKPFFRVHHEDTVAIAMRDVEAQENIGVPGLNQLKASQPITKGHKVALSNHQPGDPVIRYGHPVGMAIGPISAGDWVHTHNVKTALSGDAVNRPGQARPWRGHASALTWRGYCRGDSAGTRNEIWVLPTVGCVARTAEQAARIASERHQGAVDGIHAFAHPFGCSQLGSDLAATRVILAALAQHPNAGGVLLVGLGCESNQIDALMQSLPQSCHAKIRFVIAQEHADETKACLAAIDELVKNASRQSRVELPLSRLTIGLKCGGSDGFSGLTANPLLGRLTETVVASGGAAILTEIPEIFGAEQILTGRAATEQVATDALAIVSDFKRYFIEHGEPVSENPSPGNIAGGISTLEEKSLGAVQKAGRVPLMATLHYGKRVESAGLSLLEAPGNDAVSSTALAAAGANLILFTTGRGTPLGFPVPTIKISSNSDLARRKPNWIDFDAGVAVEAELESLDKAFLDHVIEVASGQETAAERAGQREIAIWKRGVTL